MAGVRPPHVLNSPDALKQHSQIRCHKPSQRPTPSLLICFCDKPVPVAPQLLVTRVTRNAIVYQVGCLLVLALLLELFAYAYNFQAILATQQCTPPSYPLWHREPHFQHHPGITLPAFHSSMDTHAVLGRSNLLSETTLDSSTMHQLQPLHWYAVLVMCQTAHSDFICRATGFAVPAGHAADPAASPATENCSRGSDGLAIEIDADHVPHSGGGSRTAARAWGFRAVVGGQMSTDRRRTILRAWPSTETVCDREDRAANISTRTLQRVVILKLQRLHTSARLLVSRVNRSDVLTILDRARHVCSHASSSAAAACICCKSAHMRPALPTRAPHARYDRYSRILVVT